MKIKTELTIDQQDTCIVTMLGVMDDAGHGCSSIAGLAYEYAMQELDVDWDDDEKAEKLSDDVSEYMGDLVELMEAPLRTLQKGLVVQGDLYE